VKKRKGFYEKTTWGSAKPGGQRIQRRLRWCVEETGRQTIARSHKNGRIKKADHDVDKRKAGLKEELSDFERTGEWKKEKLERGIRR